MEGTNDPYAILLSKLTGISLKKPHKPIAYNLWARENQKVVDLSCLAARANLLKIEFAGAGTKLTKVLFEGLPRAEQKEWEKKAVDHQKLALEQWELKLRSPPSVDPIDRQQYVLFCIKFLDLLIANRSLYSCIQGLVKFAQPLLDQLCLYTGMHMTLLAGGPEPGDGGRLNVIRCVF